MSTPDTPTADRPYGWTGFELESETTGDGSGREETYIGIIGIWANGSFEDEIAVVTHRTCGGTYPIDGALAQQKELVALEIVDRLNNDPIDWDALDGAIDYDRATSA